MSKTLLVLDSKDRAPWLGMCNFSFIVNTMENRTVRIEEFMGGIMSDLGHRLIVKVETSVGWPESVWWSLVLAGYFPIYCIVLILLTIPIGVRLAVAHADRVIFVLATSFLSFYQVPRKVFYVYMAVLVVTGILQFLRYDSPIRTVILLLIELITCEKGILFLRKFTSFHSSNPFNRKYTTSKVVFIPVGFSRPYSRKPCGFEFSTSVDLNFHKDVGDCEISIHTFPPHHMSLRGLNIEAPWGFDRIVFEMTDDKLGKLISYFNHVAATNGSEIICYYANFAQHCRALTILETIDYFNRGKVLIRVEVSVDRDSFKIV